MKIHPMKSVFIKLLGTYFLAFLVIILAGAAARFFFTSSPNMEISRDKLDHYSAMLAAEIGTPPDLEKAQDISGETGLNIVVSGPGLNWSSTGIAFHEEDDFPYFFPDILDPSITVVLGEYTYRFNEFHSDMPMSVTFWLILGGLVIAAMVLSYFMVRRLLNPLKKMNRVAHELGKANWKERVNPRGSDELAFLGRTIDSMADRIERYIRSMHDLLAAISHELRSPLTRMKVALEFIDNAKVRESLSEEINILDRMTGNLLEQRRLSEGMGQLNRETIQLHGWIDEISKPYLLGDFPLIIEKAGPDRTVELDRSRMELAIRNLIGNAERYAPGSPVTLSVHTDDESSAYSLEVSDRGPGVPEEILSRLGEPFFLGDSSRAGNRDKGGFGLGLSIVKAVAEAHGAAFAAENLREGGLAVRIAFGGSSSSAL